MQLQSPARSVPPRSFSPSACHFDNGSEDGAAVATVTRVKVWRRHERVTRRPERDNPGVGLMAHGAWRGVYLYPSQSDAQTALTRLDNNHDEPARTCRLTRRHAARHVATMRFPAPNAAYRFVFTPERLLTKTAQLAVIWSQISRYVGSSCGTNKTRPESPSPERMQTGALPYRTGNVRPRRPTADGLVRGR